MPIAPDFTSVFEQEWYVHFTQCNPNGKLKYTELCNYLQLTAGFHAEKGGISYTDMQAADQAWVLSRMRVEVDDLPRWGDTIIVRTWIVSLENSRSVRAMEVYRDGVKIAGCETFWAVINTKRRRPEELALPHAHFEKFGESFSTKDRVRRLQTVAVDATIAKRSVAVSDLDIVSHVNNVKYLEWCLDVADPETVLKNRLSALDMNFMRELVLGDEVAIASEDNRYTVLKDGKPCFALEVTMKP